MWAAMGGKHGSLTAAITGTPVKTHMTEILLFTVYLVSLHSKRVIDGYLAISVARIKAECNSILQFSRKYSQLHVLVSFILLKLNA